MFSSNPTLTISKKKKFVKWYPGPVMLPCSSVLYLRNMHENIQPVVCFKLVKLVEMLSLLTFDSLRMYVGYLTLFRRFCLFCFFSLWKRIVSVFETTTCLFCFVFFRGKDGRTMRGRLNMEAPCQRIGIASFISYDRTIFYC